MACNFLFSAMQVISSERAEGAKFRLSGKGVDQDPKGIFRINEISGDVSVTRTLDREAIANYEVSIPSNRISVGDTCFFNVCLFLKGLHLLKTKLQLLSYKISRSSICPLEIVNVFIFWNSTLLSACNFCHLSVVESVWTLCVHLICEYKVVFGQKEIFSGSCHFLLWSCQWNIPFDSIFSNGIS